MLRIFSIKNQLLKALSASSGLKSVFEKLRFRDVLVWTVGLTVKIKLRFQIYAAWKERMLDSCPAFIIIICVNRLNL